MRRHAMDEWIDTGDEEGAAKAFDAMDERIRPPIGAQPRQIIPSRTTLDACQRAGCPIEAGAIHAWLCTWSVRSIDGTPAVNASDTKNSSIRLSPSAGTLPRNA